MRHCNYLLSTMTMQTQPNTGSVLPSWMMLIFVPGLLGAGIGFA